MEYDAKRLLMQRLDDCLKTHADFIKPGEIASIYDLQDLAEMHCYLKTEHQFTSEEVDALLQFQDPLDVARWCKEDNPHQNSFPICKLLDTIGAYDRFPLEPGASALEKLTDQFNAALTRNMYTFRENMVTLSPNTIYDYAKQIVAVNKTYANLMNHYMPVAKEMEYLLQFDNPLWIISQFGPHDDINFTTSLVCFDTEHIKNVDQTLPWEKPSVRSRLEQVKNEIKGKPTKVTPSPKIESR